MKLSPVIHALRILFKCKFFCTMSFVRYVNIIKDTKFQTSYD